MSTMDIVAALRKALDSDPRNGTLWLHLADLLDSQGDLDQAIAAVRTAMEIEESALAGGQKLIPLLRRGGHLAEALIRVEKLLESADDPALRLERERILTARGDTSGESEQRSPEVPKAASRDDEVAVPAPVAGQEDVGDNDDWASHFDWGELHVSFDDVVGLEEVKRQIHLRIIAPFTNEEIYRSFQREAGGGLLMYGPPGCGKTFVARATAGELKARFVPVSIHEVVDKYWGESEKFVHALFDEARRHGPTVLFFDEFDALGSSRGRGESQFWKTLVNQLLQEMDGIKGRSRDLLLFAATNMPWSVDAAFRRPGRFDRVLFVPPPDAAARRALLARHCERLPGAEGLDLQAVAARTKLFTGADLKHLCERSSETALERSLESGEVHPVTMSHFSEALNDLQSSAIEWFATARNYARYSNDGGQYDHLVRYLKSVKQW